MNSWQGNVRFQPDCINYIFFAIAYLERGLAEILVPCDASFNTSEIERKSTLNGMIIFYVMFFFGYIPGFYQVSKNTPRRIKKELKIAGNKNKKQFGPLCFLLWLSLITTFQQNFNSYWMKFLWFPE